MDSQFKPGFDGTQAPASRPAYTTRPSTYVSSSGNSTGVPAIVLRAVAVLLTFFSAIVMGVAKQTKTVTVVDPNSLDSESITGTVKATYSSAYVYFVIVNVIVFVYSAAALAMSIARRGTPGSLELPLSMADLAAAVLLLTCNGAASNTSMVAHHGSLRLGWDKFCYIVGKFCGQTTAAIVLSMLASVTYVLLLVLGILALHKRGIW